MRQSLCTIIISILAFHMLLLLACTEKKDSDEELIEPKLVEMLEGKWQVTSVTFEGELMPEWNDFELEINHLGDNSGNFIASGIPHYDSVKYYFNQEEYAPADDYPKINEIWIPNSTWKLNEQFDHFIRDNQALINIAFDQDQAMLGLNFDISGWPQCKPNADTCPKTFAYIGIWRFLLSRTNE